MKKLFTILSFVLLLPISCTRFDDSAIWEELLNHRERIEKLEAECNRLNSNIEAMQAVLEALETGDYVTDIVKVMEDGVEVGFCITFAKGGKVTIYHGTDCSDGSAPKVGIQKASDGQYYWTVDGEWMTDDDGARIPAVVADDGDGRYITPQFRVAEGIWYISYDNGNSWKQLPDPEGQGEGLIVGIDNTDSDYLVLILANGEKIRLRKDTDCSGIHPASDAFSIELTPLNYHTISKPATELLSCAPCMVSYGNGDFVVTYLADEANSVETESSKTIVCRLRDFNILSPSQGKTVDVAVAGQTISDVTISKTKAPYEPNILKIDDRNLLVLFNFRDTDNNYLYYSATYDTETKEIISYQPIYLDGREWNPSNVASSYNSIAENSISASGPSSSMVFTSKIVKHQGYYYGYCGGVCSGFAGILVRSTDGINWESFLAPKAAADMAGVIECGFQFLNNHVYLCMRDISSGIYHCSYEYQTKKVSVSTIKLPGLTTSKPAAFIEDGQMYVIVNKDTGDDATVGRRNTALFYRVDPSTCGWTPTKEVFCRDGVAYHCVENYNNTNYWCFHTDARRINPYTQGRSNLAFLQVPKMVENAPQPNDKVLVGLSVIAEPSTTYLKNSCFSTAGMILAANYADSYGNITSQIVSNEDCTYYPDLTTPLTESGVVTITYNSGNDVARKSIVVTVKDGVKDLSIVTGPARTKFVPGECFDPTGMEVLATFSDNTMALVNDYSYSPSGPLTAADNQITICYGGQTCTLEITMQSFVICNLNDYAQYYTRGAISTASNSWQEGAVNMHYQIPLDGFKAFNTLTVTANDQQPAYIAFLTKRMTQSGPVAYAEGWTEQLIIAPSQTKVLEIPADAIWLYVLSTRASGESMLPTLLEFSSVEVLPREWFKGKSLWVFGDSITAGVGTTSPYYFSQILCDNLEFGQLTRLGNSGYAFSHGINDYGYTILDKMETSLAKAPGKCDVLIVCFGVNDWTWGRNIEGDRAIGSLTDNTKYTICGAVNLFCQKLQTIFADYPDVKIYFSTPTPTKNAPISGGNPSGKSWDQSKQNYNGNTLRDICETIADVAHSYGYSVLDLNQYFLDEMAAGLDMDALFPDGLHPNETGNEKIALILEDLLVR